MPGSPAPPDSSAPPPARRAEAAEALERSDRRARRKAETRARLLAAARRLFVQHGYHGTRPQDVARAADLGAGTFYVHFADKRELFLAFTEQSAEELMGRVRAATAGTQDFETRLRRSLEALLAYADDHPGVLGAAFADAEVIAAGLPREASLRERLAGTLATSLRHDMRAGTLRTDLDPDVVAHGLVGFLHHALAHGLARRVPRRDLLETVTRFCALPLAPPRPAGAPHPPEEPR